MITDDIKITMISQNKRFFILPTISILSQVEKLYLFEQQQFLQPYPFFQKPDMFPQADTIISIYISDYMSVLNPF